MLKGKQAKRHLHELHAAHMIEYLKGTTAEESELYKNAINGLKQIGWTDNDIYNATKISVPMLITELFRL